jgi:hypothetical protein
MTHTQHRFYKDNEGWFIDLPEFLEMGLGTKGNLAMVAGSDLLLDELSGNGDDITLEISDQLFEGFEHHMVMGDMGMDQDVLEEYGHPIQIGGYYHRVSDGFQIWLCPVCRYVFQGDYPEHIYVKKVV